MMTGKDDRVCTVGRVEIGPGRPLTIIAGPCVLESLELGLEVGRKLADACEKLGLTYIFKASYDKANRSSIDSPRGPGIDKGLEWLAGIRRELGVPVTTDIHSPDEAQPVSQVVDLIQIPAFLCRQTDLLIAAGVAAKAHNRAVNIKKGQFMSPGQMGGPVRKLHQAGCDNVMLTERGTFFGYGRLVNDFIGFGDLMELDAKGGPPPACFDVTHSTQVPGEGKQTGGRPDRAAQLARAATAAGAHALFIEAHPKPKKAMSDGATQLPPDQVVAILADAARIRGAIE
jgi:2-dehydro-3-deoxyphosphooctonate aldolase (KDO 8-P synthase)